jgi:tetratricopeptide (TPR) repeat protein
VNAEKEGVDLAKKYNVHGYPTILFLNQKGDVVYKIGGYLPPAPFKQEIGIANEVNGKLSGYEKKLLAHPNDLWTMERLALIYAKQENVARAVPLVEKAEKLDPKAEKGALSDAYDALGAYYQGKEDNEHARSMYEKAYATTKEDFVKADAGLSLAQVYVALNQPEKAVPYLEALKAMPNAPDIYKTIAARMLEKIQKK